MCRWRENKTRQQEPENTRLWIFSGKVEPRVHKEQVTRVRACNYVKIETGQNFPPVLKIVTRTVQAA